VASELPTGTVTFLFTDVEGSTKLLDELGAQRYAEALDEHRAIVRGTLVEHGGVEVDTQGDAFFCAFASARAAVACARDVQDALSTTSIRVRIGVHTGEALVAGGHYVGMDVHRAARIGACGHGGQVVLSPSTVALLEPGEFDLADLGEHRLKDLSAPVRLHQLGRGEFLPLKTLFRTNLPVPATPFLGRERELRDLVDRASEPDVRLLTLTGPGGTGKTRLSLQLAAEISGSYADGTWWVPLAPLRDPSLVVSALASVLEVEEEPGRSLTDSVTGAFAGKRALVLLDNCEHLVDAVAEVASAVVAACPHVRVLATSREALAIGGEQVFPVEPLVDADAVELFFARARSVGASLDDEQRGVVTELCGRLDNLPLAVELAAARAAALPPAALLERLSSGLDVLKGPRDVDERQRTLRATIAWSHGLLDEREQRLFRRLAVFVGGASLDAIDEICDADLEDLLSLVAKSLVRQAHVEGAEPRYFMLETIREFAAAELETSGERQDLQERHLELFTGLAREVRKGLEGSESGLWLARCEHDLANLRAAFTCATAFDRRDEVLALAMALSTRHFFRGRYSEAEDVIRAALELDPGPIPLAVLSDRLGRALRVQGQPQAALDAYQAAERALESVPQRGDAWWEQWLAVKLDEATFFYFENRLDELASLVRELEPLVRDHGTERQGLALLHVRCQHAYRVERYALSEETEALSRETYSRALELGDADAEFMFGFCMLWRGKLEEAEEHLSRGREIARERGNALLETRCLVYGAIARRRRNDVEGAREHVRALESQEELHGYRGLVAANVAWIASRDGDLELATARGEDALADWDSEGLAGPRVFAWTARFPLLGVEVRCGRLDDALEHARAMLDESQQPLPDEIAGALTDAVARRAGEQPARALALARSIGYA
jgi:predicted ATPase/class 3 adenylate cyclase